MGPGMTPRPRGAFPAGPRPHQGLSKSPGYHRRRPPEEAPMDRPIVRDLIPIERVWTRLEAVEEGLRRATTSDDAFLTTIAQHLLAAGGKRYRPLLAQVRAALGGEPGDGPVAAGGGGGAGHPGGPSPHAAPD